MTEINLIYILSAMLFGMIHSMEPGHGKSLVATFVLSSSTTKKRDAFLIGLLASITHTASVYLIGYLSVMMISFISPTHKETIVSFAASGVIFTIGSYLMWDRIIRPLFQHSHEHDCSVHKILTKKIQATSILVVGLTAGLIPCSGGLAVFMTVTAVHGIESIFQGFIYVLSYSIGLGIALTLVALSTIYGQGFLKKSMEKSLGNIEKSSGIISAIIIYTIGLILLTSNITSTFTTNHKHHHHYIQSDKR